MVAGPILSLDLTWNAGDLGVSYERGAQLFNIAIKWVKRIQSAIPNSNFKPAKFQIPVWSPMLLTTAWFPIQNNIGLLSSWSEYIQFTRPDIPPFYLLNDYFEWAKFFGLRAIWKILWKVKGSQIPNPLFLLSIIDYFCFTNNCCRFISVWLFHKRKANVRIFLNLINLSWGWVCRYP